eukprot:jgi/Hompol1/2287/HPOL_002142-RA
MCGIFAIFNHGDENRLALRQRAAQLAKRIRHRGPDWSGIKVAGNNILCHERLAIVGVVWCPTIDQRNWLGYPLRQWRDL